MGNIKLNCETCTGDAPKRTETEISSDDIVVIHDIYRDTYGYSFKCPLQSPGHEENGHNYVLKEKETPERADIIAGMGVRVIEFSSALNHENGPNRENIPSLLGKATINDFMDGIISVHEADTLEDMFDTHDITALQASVRVTEHTPPSIG